MTLCGVKGCGKDCAVGARLCKEHLDQVDLAYAASKNVVSSLEETESDSYDEMVKDFATAISNSSEMRSLTEAIVRAGIRDAPEYFPGLSSIQPETLEQLAAAQAVSVVSSVIQERAHMLARAMLFSESLSEQEASGVRKLIDMEIELLKDKSG